MTCCFMLIGLNISSNIHYFEIILFVTNTIKTTIQSVKTLVQILHKHVGDLSCVSYGVKLGVADELPPKLLQLCHVDAPVDFDV